MRRIPKGQEPEELRLWKEANAELPEILTYSNMPKAEAKQQMLAEQGYLCAYTMQRIATPDDCQIEHLVPRGQNLRLQITYSNLFACSPSNRPGSRPQRGKCPFGAEAKGQTRIHDNVNFVSPLRADVEQRFRYAVDGSVTHIGGDEAAASTIGILRLNHEQLVDLRKAAIEERVLDVDMSAEEADTLSKMIMVGDLMGRVPEFCLAISHAAAWYANKLSSAN